MKGSVALENLAESSRSRDLAVHTSTEVVAASQIDQHVAVGFVEADAMDEGACCDIGLRDC